MFNEDRNNKNAHIKNALFRIWTDVRTDEIEKLIEKFYKTRDLGDERMQNLITIVAADYEDVAIPTLCQCLDRFNDMYQVCDQPLGKMLIAAEIATLEYRIDCYKELEI